MGRKPLGRERQVHLLLSEEEFAMLDAISVAEGQTLSDVLRGFIRKEHAKRAARQPAKKARRSS